MFCNECGREILNRSGYCPVCGAAVNYSVISSIMARIPSSTVGKRAVNGGVRQEVVDVDSEDKAGKGLYLFRQISKHEQKNILFYSGIGLFIVGIIQFIFFSPLLKSGFSTWNHYAYMRGIPMYICAVLPYAMVASELFIVVAGVVGICFAGWKGAARIYKMSGIVTAIAAAGLLVTYLIHSHVVFMSIGGGSRQAMLLESFVVFRKQYLRSLYPLFIIVAIINILSFFCIYGSALLGITSKINAGKAMIITGISGFAVSICGIFFGQYAGIRIPTVATWAAVAFAGMLAVGIAGFSKRRTPFTQAVLGFAQLIVFTLCMLQAIHYAYSAFIQGSFFYYGTFIWITVLSALLAVSTILSALYSHSSQLQ